MAKSLMTGMAPRDQAEHCCDEQKAGISMHSLPLLQVLYCKQDWALPQAEARMALFSPALALAPLRSQRPCSSCFGFARLVMP